MANEKSGPSRAFLVAVLFSLKRAFLGVGATSCIVNILALTGSFFMLQIYDRVIPGRSLPTLAGLAIIAATLFIFQGLLDFIRSMLLMRAGGAVDERLGGDVYNSLILLPSRMRMPGDGLQSIRDLDTVRGFLSGPGPTALFDMPWMLFYIGLCFFFHVWIGVTALAGAVMLIGLTALAEYKSRKPAKIAAELAARRLNLAEATRRNCEAVLAMGFGSLLAAKWSDVNNQYLANHISATTVTTSLMSISKVLRLMLQSGVLAVGAILVVRQEATPGIMIASSILVSRALAPVELAIGQWKAFVAARQSWSRLTTYLELLPGEKRHVDLPAPTANLSVEALHLAVPGNRTMVLRAISFRAQAGDAVGVIGPSASGKSSLARALVGLWRPVGGAVRLDKASLDQWDPSSLGRSIGYLPQEVSLFEGSIAENIARFDTDAPSEKVIAAARAAGVYEMIVQLADGFDTQIGENGSMLSAGQRQRIGLARALYGDPFLVVLDEPNSNLDSDGEAALAQAIAGVRARKGIAIVIAHRPSALAATNLVLVLANGQLQAFGAKDEVLNKTTVTTAPRSSTLTVIAGGDS
ncbi:protease secretion system ABC transporter ATP-binding protein PrtD (plasmid) [Rhizobium etli 8C-3]|uniref:ATP-binding cassette subfamily C protein n=2 Tax=Rhizobium TaxID=379 RepID=A0A4R3QVQ6_9HYPH|nr:MULTISPECIES: type I secretion system permease/ATPase [Rhizobium]APO78767.1 protease secretion system ABC transporter ATP-binding protein PrtD [Rhizobium etli 8C-3]TCU24442.1 ATP-binding cassette subfamily C protein [Rhizobium azibense]TCU39188.1 ATP-binding cassette subfamily C protein [Rhizobium azibense]